MKCGLHYAWAVCASSCIFIFICIGIVTNGFAIYLPYLHDLGINDIQESVIVNTRGAVSLLMMFVIHRYYQHLTVRTGVALSALFTFAAYLLYSVADGSFTLYCIGSAMTGVSYAFSAMIILSDVLRRWFQKDFALAVGITAAGSGIATTIVPLYVDSMVGVIGLSETFLLEAFIILALIGAAVLLFRNDPLDMGMHPYGWNGEGIAPTELHVGCGRVQLPLKIWATLGIVCMIMGAIAGPGLVFLANLFTTSGYSKTVAALAISAVGVLMIIGKIVIGAAIDRFGTYKALSVVGVLLTVGLMMSPFLNGSLFMLSVSLLLMGLGFSMMMLAPSNFAKDLSGQGEYFMVVRNFEIIYVVGSFVFAFMPGAIAEITGSYTIPYLIFGLMTASALALMSAYYLKMAKA